MNESDIIQRRFRVEDVSGFEFYKQPKQLYVGKYNHELNNNDRTIYMLLLDRFRLSMMNHFVDDEGYVYIYFTADELARIAAVSEKTVRNSINKLKEIKLIDSVQQGLNRPNRIYVLKLEYQEEMPVNGENILERNFLPIQEKVDGKNFPADEKITVPEWHNSSLEGKILPPIKNNNKSNTVITNNNTSEQEVFETIILKSGEEYPVMMDDVVRWQQTYSTLDVKKSILKMKDWCESNPSKRKTEAGIKRFISGWLNREEKEYATKYEEKKETKYKGLDNILTERRN